MKSIPGPFLFPFAGIVLLLLGGCVTAPDGGPAESGFEQARTVLEASCVHCHGSRRLAGMPSFASSQDLAALQGVERGSLKLAILTTVKYTVPKLLGGFCAAHPGIDVGLACAPIVFGPLMDAGRYTHVLWGVAVLQTLAIATALGVGTRSRS